MDDRVPVVEVKGIAEVVGIGGADPGRQQGNPREPLPEPLQGPRNT